MPRFALLVLLSTGCPASMSGVDGGADGGCPAVAVEGAVCSPTATPCRGVPSCTLCYDFTYRLSSLSCDCTDGHWACHHIGCFTSDCGPAIYGDSTCSIPCTSHDAGLTDAGSEDAGGADASTTDASSIDSGNIDAGDA